MTYLSSIDQAATFIRGRRNELSGIGAEAVTRMRLQNRFLTGLDIARHTAKVMRADMAAYDRDPTAYTQSLGCWHGFIAQQQIISVKKHIGTTQRRYLYLSGWSPRSDRNSGPCPISRCTKKRPCRR